MMFQHLEPLPEAFNYQGKLAVVAGPCSVETREQVLSTARALHAGGVGVLRAGLWKPRTRPDSFQGVGAEGIAWMLEARRSTGMLLATEVATVDHLQPVLDAGFDVIWLGARTTSDPFAVQALADALARREAPLPVVMVKNPISADVELWIGALQRIFAAGGRRLVAVHRGFTAGTATAYRNAPAWSVVSALRRRCPELPILCDPSHIAGDRALVAEVAQDALSMGLDGLMIESHICPERALSDAPQQLSPAALLTMLASLQVRRGGDSVEALALLRRQIDECDRELLEVLSRRMEIVEQIGEFKRAHDIAVVQTGRYEQVLERLTRAAADLQLDPAFVARLYALIHDESAKRQMAE